MSKRPFLYFVLLVGLVIVAGLAIAYSRANASADGGRQTSEVLPGGSGPGATTRGRVSQALFDLPLRFIANVGQTAPDVRFTVKGGGPTLFFTDDEIVFSVSIPESRILDLEFGNRPHLAPGSHPKTRAATLGRQSASAVRLRFPGANPHPTIEGLAPMPGVANFFLGNEPVRWRANVPTFGAVAYRDLYPGIDLVYRGTEGYLKSEFRLAPGADPAAIQMAYSGLEGMGLREDGALVLQTALGELIEEAPLIYQEVDGVRQAIAGGYVLISSDLAGFRNLSRREHRVGFQVAAYDPALPLVIDPVLAYSTYLGFGWGFGIAVDSAGNVYVTGETSSSDFPTHNAIQPGYGGGFSDAFVTQLINASGVYTYGYSTYLGGGGNEDGFGIAVDSAGNAYVTGYTESSDFPTHNAIQPGYGGGLLDAFVTQVISASGVYTLGYSTYLGGGDDDWGWGIAVDGDGNALVAGTTYSSDFPTTTNAIQPDRGGGIGDGFVTHIISTGGVYTYGYSTYLGGGDLDGCGPIAVDDAGNVYVAGATDSSDFPTTTNAIQPSYGGGGGDAFVTQIISASGVYTLGYSTYLGGGDDDWGSGIALDGDGNVTVAGATFSSDFPTFRAIQTDQGFEDVFVTKIISVSGVYTYAYSTYLGGDSTDGYSGWVDVAADSAGGVYVTGETSSSDFPTRNAIQPDYGGGTVDVFVTQIVSASGIYTLGYSTYLGGDDWDRGFSIAVDGAGNAYVTGMSGSSDFPTTPNAIQRDLEGGVFMAKISPAGLVLRKTVIPGIIAPGQALTYTLVYTNDSQATATGVLITDVVPITLTHVGFTSSGATITPTGSVSYTWQVEALSPGMGGVILITGIVSPSVSDSFTLTNQATIVATDVTYVDPYLDDNVSVVHSRVDGEPPIAPTLISPADSAVISDTTPVLVWGASPSPDVVGYLLDWNGTITDVGDVTQYTVTVWADGTYTWTVAAYDALYTSPYTDFWSFTVDATAPDAPTLLSPADGAVISDTTPALVWGASPSPDVAGYLLDLRGTVTDVGATTQYTTNVLADGVYTWTVAAYDAVRNTSPYTDAWLFTEEARSPAIIATVPVSGAVDVEVTAPVVIAFSEAINPGTFSYTVAPDPGGWAEAWVSAGTVVTLTHVPFAWQTAYTVTVTAADDLAGNPLSGAPYAWSFATASYRVCLPLVLKGIQKPYAQGGA